MQMPEIGDEIIADRHMYFSRTGIRWATEGKEYQIVDIIETFGTKSYYILNDGKISHPISQLQLVANFKIIRKPLTHSYE